MVADKNLSKALKLDLCAEARAAGVARRAVAEFAIASGASDAITADVELAVSEAVTNVVVHAYRNRDVPGRVRVVAERVRQELVVLVCDDGMGMHPRPDSPGLGLGLAIIASVAQALEVSNGSRGGTELRMRFLLVADPGVVRSMPIRGDRG